MKFTMKKMLKNSLVVCVLFIAAISLTPVFAADVVVQQGNVTAGNVTSGTNPGHTHTQSSLVLKGMIHQAYVDYNDSDTVTITAGYGECNGDYWEITSSTDHDMTSLASGEDFHYIYIDDSNSLYPDPCIIDSTTEPAWSDSKLGWYNGNDRCIGVVWSPDSGATLLGFTNNSDLKWVSDIGLIKQVLSNGNPNGAVQRAEATAYIPVNAIATKVGAWNSDSDGDCLVSIGSWEAPEGSQLQACSANGTAVARCWVPLERGASRDLMWFGPDNDDNGFGVKIYGFQIER